MSAVSVAHQLKRLDTLAEKCGVKDDDARRREADMANMTPYEQQQFKVATSMHDVRDAILELDNLPDSATAGRKATLGNNIRKGIAAMKREAAEAKRFAQREDRRTEYEKLLGHLKKTEHLYKARFASQEGGDAAFGGGLGGLGGGGGGGGPTKLDEEMSSLARPMVNLREDEEFQQFFAQTQVKDQAMDQALDRIQGHVLTMKQQATTIQEELRVQDQVLTETETKVNKLNTDLKQLNRKLRKTLKEVKKDRIVVYLICVVLLLGLGGAIYWQVSSLSH